MTLPRADEPTAAAEVSVGADRWLAFARRGHDYCSQIFEADCLIRLDNFRPSGGGLLLRERIAGRKDQACDQEYRKDPEQSSHGASSFVCGR
jgi:hypothetical protein